MTDKRQEAIDAMVRGVIEEFGGRFELVSKRPYTSANSMDLFCDVRDALAGYEFRILATTATDVRRQLRARVQEIA